MGTGVSPLRVHGYRCQSTECSWVQVSVHRVLMGTGVSPQSFHSTEGSWVQVSVHGGFMGTGVSPQRVEGFRFPSTESSWV
jgi:hypothetical protein